MLDKKQGIRMAKLLLGPAGALVVYLSLSNHHYNLKITAALASLMALWWLTEALPVFVTALMPLVLFPLFGIATLKTASIGYVHPIIFLFMGGFMMAKTMERWDLHQRVALNIIQMMGDKPSKIIAGFMMASFLLSMWISNTATVVMMLPIAMSVLATIDIQLCKEKNKDQSFDKALLLGIAYAASIGGVCTLIGSPPNALFAAFMEQQYNQTLNFFEWMKIGLPFGLLFLPISYVLLTKIVFPIRAKRIPGINEVIHHNLSQLGKMKRADYSILLVFSLVILLWLFNPLIALYFPVTSSLNDPTIAILGALLMFLIPSGDQKEKRLLNWKTAKKIPWPILILFGGGLSLASALSQNGVAHLIGEQIASMVEVHPLGIVFMAVTLVIFLTEIMSNTATTAAFLPILASVAVTQEINPIVLLLPTTMAASFAFMMPVATPPNAIIFSSKKISIFQMARAGFLLNLMGIAFISLYTWYLQDLIELSLSR